MRRLCLYAVAALALVGCQTTEQADARRATENQLALNTSVGRTMANFTESTGLTPSDAYDTDEGRVFVVDITNICRVFLVARQESGRVAADAWRIARPYARGRCFLE